jgi:hypothetical protein
MFRKFSFILFAAILSVFSLAGSSFAQDSPESQATKVVEDFFVAMDKGDINAAINLTEDSRYSNPKELTKAYTEYKGSRSFKHLEILSTVLLDTESVVVQVKSDSTPVGVTEEIFVKNYDSKWKISLGGNKNESTPSTEFSIQTLADHFEFTGFSSAFHYTNDTFTIPSGVSNIVVQGWQYSSNNIPARVSYQLAKGSWLGYDVYGTPFIADGNGEYEGVLSNAPSGSGYCIEIHILNSAVVNGAGNVMYNP